MTEVRIIIPAKTGESDIADDHVQIVLNRCRLPRCQVALPPTRVFCTGAHKSEFNRKFRGIPLELGTLQQGCLTF